MKITTRVGSIAASLLLVTRAIIGLIIMGLDRLAGEADMLLLLDVPTMAAYGVSARLGFPHDIVNAYDVRFFVTGLLVWALFGYVAGWGITRIVIRSRTEFVDHHIQPGV